MSGSLGQLFTGIDYLLALPIILLSLFALGILIIDLMLPTEWKLANPITALVGVFFAAAGVFFAAGFVVEVVFFIVWAHIGRGF